MRGVRMCLTQWDSDHLPLTGARPTKHISMKIQNALVSNILDRSQRYFAHVTTVTLSWRVQNIVVIGRVYFTLECFEFSSNFEFDRNMLSGTGARPVFRNVHYIRTCDYLLHVIIVPIKARGQATRNEPQFEAKGYFSIRNQKCITISIL